MSGYQYRISRRTPHIWVFVVVLLFSLRAAAEENATWLDRAINSQRIRAQARVSTAAADMWTVELAPAGVGKAGTTHSFEEAQARVRAFLADIRAGLKIAKPVVVRIAAGAYSLPAPLHFGPEDSGDETFPVSYVAEEPGRVIVSGGVTLQASSASGGRLKYDLPIGFNVDWNIPHQLFIGSHRAVLARQPNEGMNWFVQPGSHDKGTVEADAQAIEWLRSLSGDDKARAELVLYHSWTASRHRFYLSGNALSLAVPAKWAPLSFGSSQRFYVENVTAALDAPGEWIGTARQVTYIPVGDEAKAKRAAVLPLLPKLIVITGSVQNPIKHLSFSGIQFSYSESFPNEGNFIDGQAAQTVGAAIEVDHARHVEFHGCKLSHLGGYGIWMRENVADSMIENTIIHDVGAGGIKVGTGGKPASLDATTHNITITNAIVADTGRIFPGAVGIWVGWANGNRIEKNIVANTTYSGISVGWKWGFGGPASQGNRINRNVLFNIGQATLSDLGAIYTLGESPGTEIIGNFIREVRSYPNYGGWNSLGAFGIYLDEGSSGIRVANNVVVGTDSGGFHINYGRDNLVQQNVIARGEQAEVTLFHDKGGNSMEFSGNTLFPISLAPFQGELNPNNSTYQNNLVGGAADSKLRLGVCARGCLLRSAQLEVGHSLLDLRVVGSQSATDSVQRAVAEVGPEGDFNVLREISIVEHRPKLSRAAAAAARGGLDFAVSMAAQATGTRPNAFQYRPATEPIGISVVKDTGSPDGQHCLRFFDGPNFHRTFEPFVFAEVGASQGPWTFSFVLKVDGRAEFIHEWRDSSMQPYHSGPKLVLHRGVAEVGGRPIADVRAGQWYRYTIRAKPGETFWSLDIEGIDGGSRQSVHNLPLGSPSWSAPRWVGFISNAVTQTEACLADVRMTSD